MRILLATDGSNFSDAAVTEVANGLWPTGSEVKIISVVETPVMPVIEAWVPPGDYYEALEKAAEEQASATLERAATRLRSRQKDGLRVTTEIIRGHPKHAIVEEADNWDADLVVVGSHGYRGLTRLWLGSVSQAVASHARCSVEIVRSREADCA